MKLASSSLFFSEHSYLNRFQFAKDMGFDGIEIRLEEAPGISAEVDQIERALGEVQITPCSLIVRSPAFRAALVSDEAKIAKIKSAEIALKIASRLKVPTILQPEYQAQNPLPLFDELKRPSSEELKLWNSFLMEVAGLAEKYSAIILLEPINRYETHYHHRLQEAISLCDMIESRYLKVCADFFHMSIEEENISKSIKEADRYIFHVHLADSNRRLPGQGHTNFIEGFQSLKDIGYERFLALECKKPIDFDELISCKQYLDHSLEEIK